MKNRFLLTVCTLILTLSSLSVQAQFEEPEFEKVTNAKRAAFERIYINRMDQTGRGLYNDSRLDTISTHKLRAKLQAVFGAPTQTVGDLIDRPDFRAGMAIQFEYWFIVDGKIPLLVLDEKGPFGRELVYGGASQYIDLMPQIMRTFSQKLMEAEPAEFQDYYYSADREKWYDVRYEDGRYITKEIDSPPNMSYDY
jgi:hypothetical protein